MIEFPFKRLPLRHIHRFMWNFTYSHFSICTLSISSIIRFCSQSSEKLPKSLFVYYPFLKEISGSLSTRLLTLLGIFMRISGIYAQLMFTPGIDSPRVHLIAVSFKIMREHA